MTIYTPEDYHILRWLLEYHFPAARTWPKQLPWLYCTLPIMFFELFWTFLMNDITSTLWMPCLFDAVLENKQNNFLKQMHPLVTKAWKLMLCCDTYLHECSFSHAVRTMQAFVHSYVSTYASCPLSDTHIYCWEQVWNQITGSTRD